MASVKPKRASRTRTLADQTSIAQARELLCALVDYEEAARARGLDLTASKFRELTASERELLRAELIADYIRLSAAGAGEPSEQHEEILAGFCGRICDLGIPSQELLGTYLAALDVVAGDRRFNTLDWLVDAIRKTMPSALLSCVKMIQERSEKLAVARAA